METSAKLSGRGRVLQGGSLAPIATIMSWHALYGRMDPIDVYMQYFEAECEANGVPRRAVKAALVAESRDRRIKYYVSLSFFPHEDPEDFRVSYDACWETNLYEAPGRRSKKREEELLSSFREKADSLASEHGAKIFWDRPLGEARRA